MKQRITVEQLQELTDDQKLKLREWWKPEVGDLFAYEGEKGLSEHLWDVISNRNDMVMSNEQRYFPLFSIGQMIKLADPIRMEFKNWEYDDIKRDEWVVELIGGWIYHNVDLCDALFEAVKQVL